MSDDRKLPPTPEQLDQAFRKSLEALAEEVEAFRLVAAQGGVDLARADLATHLLRQHSPGSLADLLLVAIDRLAEQVPPAKVPAPEIAPEYGNGGYV
jgi:hypothetical protein